MKKFFFLLTISTALFACDKDKDKDGTFTSQTATLHGGKVWTSVTVKDNKPEQLAIVVNDAAMNSVPVGQPTDHIGHENNMNIPVPQRALETTPFKFVMVNWNSSGHEPDDIYTLPHFDFHFYMSNASDVMNFTDATKIDGNLPGAEYVPANYIAPGPGLPRMGKHWIDVTSPELGGQVPFTQTFIYGSYDGKVVFYEPMITLDFLKASNNYERAIPQPAKYKDAGYYPTKMKIVKKDGATHIILDGFTYRQAS